MSESGAMPAHAEPAYIPRGDLTGQVALITGPAKGMGHDITMAIAREGADCILAGRDLDAIHPVAERIRGLGRRAIVVKCDITVESDAKAAVASGVAEFGRIDCFVHVVGVHGPCETPGWLVDDKDFEDVFSVNVKGAFHMAKAIAPVMIEKGGGRIVFLGGTYGMKAAPGRMVYAASKWALRGMTKTLAAELGKHNINVNIVEPGMVEGPSFERLMLEAHARSLGVSREEARKDFASVYAMKRLSNGEDVANAVTFLLSKRARQMTGMDLSVDGGWAEL